MSRILAGGGLIGALALQQSVFEGDLVTGRIHEAFAGESESRAAGGAAT